MLKRIFDFLLSAMFLVILSPLVIGIAVAIKLMMPGSVFYRGVRIGRGGKPFEMLKFRTMVVGADKIGGSSTAGDDTRVTTIGRLLRKFKLDEIPQLLNVVRGDMSFVGPRPQVEWAVLTYTSEQRAILNVRPGITDPASLLFSNEAEILHGEPDPDAAYMKLIHPEKMRVSLDYVRTRTMMRDVLIMGQTALAAARIRRYAVDPIALRNRNQ